MPDFFGDHVADLSIFPVKLPGDIAAVEAFFAGPANPPANLEKIAQLMTEIKKRHPEIEEWAVFGTCWVTPGIFLSCLKWSKKLFETFILETLAFYDPGSQLSQKGTS